MRDGHDECHEYDGHEYEYDDDDDDIVIVIGGMSWTRTRPSSERRRRIREDSPGDIRYQRLPPRRRR